MIRLLIQNWWLLLVRGVFAIAFAVFIFVFLPFVPAPLLRQLAFAGLATIFSVFAVATGLITIVAAVRGAGRGGTAWLLLADGIAVTAGGLIIMLAPGLTLAHVIQVIAGMALAVGVFEFAAGLHLRRHIADEWLLLLSGFISAAFAVCLLLIPDADRRTVLTWIALYAAAGGLAIVGLSLRLRNLRESIHALATPNLAAKTKAPAS
ncbi:MAG TPA: DUF308 domain-containing protein [Candidatus Angelobacter sp.]|nr:DUF308 domain-containing protein [Candidatus Angelobacter sp.]